MLQLIHPDTFGQMKVEDIKSPHGKKGEDGYKYLSSYPKEQQIFMLKTFYKFMFVRHPLERLLSAYRDKVRWTSRCAVFDTIFIGARKLSSAKLRRQTASRNRQGFNF